MKKYFSILAIVLLLMLTACKGGSESSSGSGDSGKSGGKVTLTYAIWDVNQAPAMKDIAKKFLEKNPNIQVKVEVTPWEQYWTK